MPAVILNLGLGVQTTDLDRDRQSDWVLSPFYCLLCLFPWSLSLCSFSCFLFFFFPLLSYFNVSPYSFKCVLWLFKY